MSNRSVLDSLTFEPGVKRRQNQQRQECRSNQPADYDGGEWTLYFRAGGRSDSHRNETQAGNQRGHQDGSEASLRTFSDCIGYGATFLAQAIDVADYYDSVQDCYSKQRNETHTRGN